MDEQVLNQRAIEQFIIQKYQNEERTMVHLFIEWCRSNKYDPHKIYHLAYPEQEVNPILLEIMKELDEQEPLPIPDETLLDLLQVFGNNELAFVISDLIERHSENKK